MEELWPKGKGQVKKTTQPTGGNGWRDKAAFPLTLALHSSFHIYNNDQF